MQELPGLPYKFRITATGSFQPVEINPQLVNGESVLGSDYTISAEDTWEDTGLSVTLPSAGVYMVIAVARGRMKVTSDGEYEGCLVGKLYNSTASADVTDSEFKIVQNDISYGNTTTVDRTATLVTLITVTQPSTIKLYAKAENTSAVTFTTKKISSGTPGRTRMSYVRVG